MLRLGKGGRLTRLGPEKASLEKELKMVVGTHHGTVFVFFSLNSEMWKVRFAGCSGSRLL